jgi:hypothetical protein
MAFGVDDVSVFGHVEEWAGGVELCLLTVNLSYPTSHFPAMLQDTYLAVWRTIARLFAAGA